MTELRRVESLYYNSSSSVRAKDKPYIRVNTRKLNRVFSTKMSTLYILLTCKIILLF